MQVKFHASLACACVYARYSVSKHDVRSTERYLVLEQQWSYAP